MSSRLRHDVLILSTLSIGSQVFFVRPQLVVEAAQVRNLHLRFFDRSLKLLYLSRVHCQSRVDFLKQLLHLLLFFRYEK